MSSQPATAPRHRQLQHISLAPFVAVLYAYCAGGPFGFEAMVSTSGPGLSLLFILIVPLLFSVPIALATAEMAAAMPVEGGFYRWTRAAFGDLWGFHCGWWNWTGTFFMSAAYGVLMADYISELHPLTPAQHWLIAFAFLALVGYLNIRGIRLVGNLTLALLLLALVPVAIFTIQGFAHARFNPFHPLLAAGKSWRETFGVGLALALWIYSGYEQLSTVSGEIEQPERNFPRALAIVVPLAVVTFFLPIAAGLAALGNWQAWETGYIVQAARLLSGPGLETAMFAAAAVCTFVLLESTVLAATRLPFTMAEDGYFHSALARLHPRLGTPARAILLSVFICAALAFLSVTRLIAIYAWLRVATSVMTLLSLWKLRRSAPQLPRRFRVPGGRLGLAAVVFLPILFFAWALMNSDPQSRLWGPLCLLAGPGAYLLASGRLRRFRAGSISSGDP
ncbi:MAG TPA: APC family permease [Terriglobales bacterium]|nr:APC family permease [Terriglobales bacterium]